MNVVNKLKKIRTKRVFIQYPEGLKMKILEISKNLENEGFETVICCEPTYGACDIREDEAKRMRCDVILHIGHSDFGIKTKIPVIYWEYSYNVDPIPILEKEINKLKDFKKVGLITSVQFVNATERVKDYLKNTDKQVYMHQSLKYQGQITGCNVDAAKKIENYVDCYLFVGAGKFHPLGVALGVKKPVFSLDVEKGIIYDLNEEKMKWTKKKLWHEAQLVDAKKVGIIVCWKNGLNKIKEVMTLKKELEKKGKDVYILAFDRVTKEKLDGMKFDCLVNFACPRLEDELIS